MLGTRAACAAVGRPRSTHYRRRRPKRAATSNTTKPRPRPRNALRVEEIEAVLAELRSERFVDLSPAQVFHVLLDEGVYGERLDDVPPAATGGRGRRAPAAGDASAASSSELVARRPNAVWSWDIERHEAL